MEYLRLARVWPIEYAASGRTTSEAYQTVDGIEQDFALAMTLYAKATERGYLITSDGKFGLGSFCKNGQGIRADRSRAIAFCRKAAALGNQTAFNAV